MFLLSPMQYIDTNVIIRFLTGDDPKKQEASASLFERAETGELHIVVPEIVIAEAVHVLFSPKLYNHNRQEVAELLTPLLQIPNLEVQNRQTLIRALQVYAETKELDFPDAYIIASMEQTKATSLFSFDTDFDDFPFIRREEPQPLKKAA
jgi:predicted nucleic acid-binding protein